MFEKLISDLLNQHLGRFIENIDSKQLGASIYSGSLKLSNMRLKESMFDDSPLPFYLKHGQVGLISIKIPYWDMFKSPLVIEISDIFGLAKIKPMSKWDEGLQQKAFRSLTQDFLE